MSEEVRIDKWLWSVRIYKTRSQATEACKKGRVLINKQPVKPSHIIKIDDIIEVKKQPVIYSYKVKSLLLHRIGAKNVPDYLEDLTPEDERNKLKMIDDGFFIKMDKGSGRPTKQERRKIDKIFNSSFDA